MLSGARLAGVPVIYVVVRFRPGYPEVSDRNPLFRGLKEAGRLGEGTPGAEIHAQVAPQSTEVIVTKRRVGAFSDRSGECLTGAAGDVSRATRDCDQWGGAVNGALGGRCRLCPRGARGLLCRWG